MKKLINWERTGRGRRQSSDGRFIIEEREEPVNGHHYVLIDNEGITGDNEYHESNDIKCECIAEAIITREASAKREKRI